MPERSEGRASGHAGRGARGQRAWLGFETAQRANLAARTVEVGSADTTASQNSHVIYRGHILRCPKNVVIPTMQIRCLNESSRNYVRNCWLAVIAGRQGNEPSNTSREGPTCAEGTGGTVGPGAKNTRGATQ